MNYSLLVRYAFYLIKPFNTNRATVYTVLCWKQMFIQSSEHSYHQGRINYRIILYKWKLSGLILETFWYQQVCYYGFGPLFLIPLPLSIRV